MKLSLLLAALAAVQAQDVMNVTVVDDPQPETTDYWMSYVYTTTGSLQTPPPTVAPTPGPTPLPTPAPTPSPTPATPSPTPVPTPAPTGECDLEVGINCFANLTGIGAGVVCADIPPIDGGDKFCTCPDCVKELQFAYTGNPCNGLGGCVDSPGPANATTIQFFQCDSSNAAFSQDVTPGDAVLLSFGGIACLPDCMDVNVLGAASELLQSFRIDTSCAGGRGFVLKDSYASIDFIGYSCDETDVNNCFLEVAYEVEACNEGITDEILFEFDLSMDGEVSDLLNGVPVSLPAGECYSDVISGVIDRCTESEYTTIIAANATNPETNKPYPCEDVEELTFIIQSTTFPPTPSPTPFPTSGSPPPSTSDCQVQVVVTPTCPVVGCEWNRCLERPFRLEFRVVPAPCEFSALNRCELDTDNTCACDRNRTLEAEEWPDQKFFCTDDPDGAGVTTPDYRAITDRPVSETFWVVATPERDPSIIYFNGPITFGTEAPQGANVFNATDPGLERVEANGYLRLYTADPAEGGVQLQEVLFHSSCSQELWLFDIFGSFQLIEFEGLNSGVIGSFDSVNLEFTINLDATSVDGPLLLDFFSITLLTKTPGLLLPQTQEFAVDGVTIPPSFVTDWDVSITPELEYVAITTIGGNLNGIDCFDVSQTPIFCPRVITPGETPGPNPGDFTPTPSVAP